MFLPTLIFELEFVVIMEELCSCRDKLEEEKEFVIVGDLSELKATAETPNGVNGGQEENKQEDGLYLRGFSRVS